MSSSPTAPHGLFDAVVGGWELALTRRRRLLTAQAPALAVMLVAFLALDLSAGRDHTLLLDGVVTLDDGASAQEWLRAVLAPVCCLVALAAGVLALAGPDPDRPVRSALGRLPMLSFGHLLAVAVAFAALWVLRNMAGVVLFIAILALGSARVLLELVTSRPRWSAVAGVVLGGYGLALLLAWIAGRVVPQILAAPANIIVLVVSLTATAGIVALQADPLPSLASGAADRAGEPAGADKAGEPAEADKAGEPVAADKAGRVWPAVAVLIVPLLLSGGVAVANPLGAPVITTDEGPAGGAAAVAWPAGQHPVMVTTMGVRFCDTDLCDRYTGQTGGPALWDVHGAAAIGADGTVAKAAISGGVGDGGPFVHYARCTRDGCPEAWVPVRRSAREEFDDEGGMVELAVAPAPDGAVWFFLAIPIPPAKGTVAANPDDEFPAGRRYRLTLIRCAGVPCAAPQRHDVGTIDRTPADGYPDGRRARLTLTPDGSPLATLWIGYSLHQITCDPVTCANPRTADPSAAPPGATWLPPATLGGPAISLDTGLLRRDLDEQLLTGRAAAESGGLARTPTTLYAAEAEPGTRPTTGFQITVGTAPAYWRQVLWRCRDQRCTRTPLDVYEGVARPEQIAPGPDGRVLIVREDRTLLVSNL
ncbi:hypothetical protein AB0M02_20770 [Actinoplanes sp. NPDC051861]|uniref:hypothetical protein n=1 Tax=Actinoplanes sp. NPDC051861 TaxID=3155170 RepID=UPI00341E2AF7